MTDHQPIRSHRDLTAWQKAMVLRRRVHLIVVALPRETRFEIGAQVQRSALSIPSNIAEGHARLYRNDYRQFLSIARGSAAELDTQLQALKDDHAERAESIDAAFALLDEVGRMITTIIQKL